MTDQLSSAVDQVLFRPSIAILLPVTTLVNRLLRPDLPLNNAGRPPIRSRTETTSSSSQTPAALPRPGQRNASRNTPPRSSATSAPRNSHVHTIFDPTFALTRMSDHSCAMSAPKHLPASMTESATKASTAARRNLYAKASSVRAETGVVAGGLPARTHWAGTSAAKPAASASSPCWTRRPWSASATSTRP